MYCFFLGLCGAIFFKKTVCLCFYRNAFAFSHPLEKLQNHCMFCWMKSPRFVAGGLCSSIVECFWYPGQPPFSEVVCSLYSAPQQWNPRQQFDCFLCSRTQLFSTNQQGLNLLCHWALLISIEALILKSVTAWTEVTLKNPLAYFVWFILFNAEKKEYIKIYYVSENVPCYTVI